MTEWTDERLDNIVGRLLQVGVVVAVLVMLSGAVIFLSRYGHAVTHYHLFRGEPTDLRRVGGIVSDALAVRGRGLMQLGVLLLIATPIARVVLSLFVFVLQRDRTYVIVTAIVLAVLLSSLLTGR